MQQLHSSSILSVLVVITARVNKYVTRKQLKPPSIYVKKKSNRFQIHMQDPTISRIFPTQYQTQPKIKTNHGRRRRNTPTRMLWESNRQDLGS
ncbi:hypothetical protein BDV30DRAFT_138867 [Aspergillus minisclerotigenes]|uniref:Uncharacterized protein n=1 Tax=Aspergillus minisclerotigenes TaxID=656917 RepID=A0A5N6J2I6_9EURO|nr:hypothetical protein BDV30DRAFT_138867 [Aspergillus minisclerotigenes]